MSVVPSRSFAPSAGLPPCPGDHLLPQAARRFLDRALQAGLIDPDQAGAFCAQRADRLRDYTSEDRLGIALQQAGLLTPYQVFRVLGGDTHGLALANYRVLDELGRGGMGTVYLAEHRLLKRRVAIKVLPVEDDTPACLKQRFYSEMRLLAELSHPNVVLAIDAGEVPAQGRERGMIYLVTELVTGGDLEKHVVANGLCSVAAACNYISQAAAGLQAAHDRHLIHRDVKPSNLLLAEGGVVKLVDFGLARQFHSRLTDPRALLGSVEFMPPEQSHDPSAVGREADIYGLGATLFWLLSGEGPYPPTEHAGNALRQLQQREPRRLRSLRQDVPESLDDLVGSMLERDPARRPASATAVVNALRRHLTVSPQVLEPGARPIVVSRPGPGEASPFFRALVVEDDVQARKLYRVLLEQLGCDCADAATGAEALAAAKERFDLVLLDIDLPDMDSYELCRRLRCDDNPHLKIIVLSSRSGDLHDLSESLPRGADDYLPWPITQRHLTAKARHALQLKAAQDREARLADQLLEVNRQLERSLAARSADLREAHNALLFTVAKMAESRDGETAGHLKRMQLYTRALAIEAAQAAPWLGLVDARFLEQLERCVPLHDIGKIGLPDDILLKPASLSPTERAQVQTHPVIGDRILEELGKEHGAGLDFLGMARVIVRHHHERYDGKGYPDKLAGDAIPPAARLVAVADVYDALRRMRMYKPAMSHTATVKMMTERSPGHFDPTLVQALLRCHGEFDRIYRSIEDE